MIAASVLALKRRCGYCHQREGCYDQELPGLRIPIVFFMCHPKGDALGPVCELCGQVLTRCGFASKLNPTDLESNPSLRREFLNTRLWLEQLKETFYRLGRDRPTAEQWHYIMSTFVDV